MFISKFFMKKLKLSDTHDIVNKRTITSNHKRKKNLMLNFFMYAFNLTRYKKASI